MALPRHDSPGARRPLVTERRVLTAVSQNGRAKASLESGRAAAPEAELGP